VVKHRVIDVAGTRIFYREAGSAGFPAVLLLHGFPASSHQFRFLIAALADRYHVLAPDFPAFGFSDSPDRDEYAYTFEHYTDTIEAFVRALGLTRYALYLHDYGAQVGFRLALRSPERVAALVIQNSEAYYENGRSTCWSAMEDYWSDPAPAKREALKRKLFTEDGIRREFLENLSPAIHELIDPAVISLAWTQISRVGVIEALLDLHLDYRTNVELYPKVQKYFRERRPQALVIWGRDDQYYSQEAATAYQNDLPGAEIRIIDGGHWAIETHGPDVIMATRRFLDSHYDAGSVIAA